VVGKGNVIVAQVAGGARHHVDLGAAVAPQRVQVEVAPQLGDELVALADWEGSLLLEKVGLQKCATSLRRALTRLSRTEREGLIKGVELLVLEMADPRER